VKKDGELTPFECALLVLCGAEDEIGASPYKIDLLTKSAIGGVLGYSKSHAYRQIKLLAENGYLDSRLSGTQAGGAIHYVLRQKGYDAVKKWIASPGVVPPIDGGEVFIRTRALRLVRAGDVRRGLEPIRVELERQLHDLQHQWRHLTGPVDIGDRLEFELFQSLIGAYLDWFESLDNEMGER
jgi:hypothetical protein